jgi:glutaredoxin
MEEIILYSTGCPKCRVLEAKLKQKGIQYEEVNDMDIMTEKGFMSVPVLEVNGDTMNFTEANNWINERK